MKAINVGYWEPGKEWLNDYADVEYPGLCSRRQAIAFAKKEYKNYELCEIIALEDGTWLVWNGVKLKKYADRDSLCVVLAMQGVTDFSGLDNWSWKDATAS